MVKKGAAKGKPEATTCRRCGVCCTSHQAFVTTEDVQRITAYLGITREEWDRLYDDTRWRYSEWRLIRHEGGGCAFLRFEKGLAACVIHDVKPACCEAWQPGPERTECREGMRTRRVSKRK